MNVFGLEVIHLPMKIIYSVSLVFVCIGHGMDMYFPQYIFTMCNLASSPVAMVMCA